MHEKSKMYWWTQAWDRKTISSEKEWAMDMQPLTAKFFPVSHTLANAHLWIFVCQWPCTVYVSLMHDRVGEWSTYPLSTCQVSCSVTVHLIPKTRELRADPGTELVGSSKSQKSSSLRLPQFGGYGHPHSHAQLFMWREDVHSDPWVCPTQAPLHPFSPHFHFQTMKGMTFCFEDQFSGQCEQLSGAARAQHVQGPGVLKSSTEIQQQPPSPKSLSLVSA